MKLVRSDVDQRGLAKHSEPSTCGFGAEEEDLCGNLKSSAYTRPPITVSSCS